MDSARPRAVPVASVLGPIKKLSHQEVEPEGCGRKVGLAPKTVRRSEEDSCHT